MFFFKNKKMDIADHVSHKITNHIIANTYQPGIPGCGSPRDLGLKDPDGFPWDPISNAQGSLSGPHRLQRAPRTPIHGGPQSSEAAWPSTCYVEGFRQVVSLEIGRAHV